MPFPPSGPDLPASPLPLRGVTVLVVEDSRFTCDALRLILTRSGARLRRAATLAAGRSHLGTYRPDVAIIDLGLPDGRGEALIAEAAAFGLPVLATSGDPDARNGALDAGAVAFLDKPLPSVAGFLRLVRQLVAGSGPDALGEDLEPQPADPMALMDDLSHAAALMRARGGDPAYATGFVRGLARSSGDADLERAALAASDGSGRKDLARLLAQRLEGRQPVV